MKVGVFNEEVVFVSRFIVYKWDVYLGVYWLELLGVEFEFEGWKLWLFVCFIMYIKWKVVYEY